MTFLYTAKGIYDRTYGIDVMSWKKYIKWSKLTHLTEVVSLDEMLNETLVEPDYSNAEDWDYIYTIGSISNELFYDS